MARPLRKNFFVASLTILYSIENCKFILIKAISKPKNIRNLKRSTVEVALSTIYQTNERECLRIWNK